MRGLIRRITPLLYAGVILISTVIAIKPGASIFYSKKLIRREDIRKVEGYAYQYDIEINTTLFPPKGVLLFENDKKLQQSSFHKVIEFGEGAFFLSDPERDAYTISFSASDNIDPRSNGRNYTLFFPITFLSRSAGLVYLSISILFLAVFVFTPITNHEIIAQNKSAVWRRVFYFSVISAYAYVFMEWLFFVTKPSFMDIISFPEKLELIFLTGFSYAAISIVFISLFFGLDVLFARLKPTSIFILFATFIPALILSLLSMLLIDNFTYIVFQFGVVSTDGIWRILYIILLLALFLVILRKTLQLLNLRGETQSEPADHSKKQFYFTAALLIFSVVLGLIRLDYRTATEVYAKENTPIESKRPNILLLGSDGLDAAHMSVYGYERATTPRIQELAQNSLVAENAFPNAAHSSGSIVSLMTSKLPTQTRVLFPPNILKGTDAYQHLPGILKQIGYRNVEIGVNHYVDAYNMNLLNGFDVVNERSRFSSDFVQMIRKFGYDNMLYFASEMETRIVGRLSHIYYAKRLENPFHMLTKPGDNLSDRERLNQAVNLIYKSREPLFIHVHMMGTHGPKFYPDKQVFSEGQEQDMDWSLDFYDDAILNFDTYIGELLDTLERDGILENTVIIIYTDHGMKYKVNVRIPLIIHFPGDQYAGRITSNVQNLDIAPTILDYLDLPQLQWMEGQSLLRTSLQSQRIILSAGTQVDLKDNSLDLKKIKPPFYQFSYINFIDCQNWHQFELREMQWSNGEIANHTAPCSEDGLRTLEDMERELRNHLSMNGFDITSLP